MPLDFPANPTNGQVYDNWIYSTAKGAWQSKPLTTTKTLISASAPSSPAEGDQWFNSDDGTLSIYYNDGNTSQWVEARAPITADGYKSPNYLINGAFDIWQRGTSFTSTAYTADRWWAPISGGTVAQETSDLPTGFRFGIRYSSSGAGQFGQFNQPLETANVIPLRGKTVTVSGWLKITGSFSGDWYSQAYYSTSTDAYASQTILVPGSSKIVGNASTTSWTRFSNTFIVPTDAVGMRIENLPANTQPNGVTVRMTGIQLEEGTAATTFRRNSEGIQGELAACQRYYWRNTSGSTNGNTYPGAVSATTTIGQFYVTHPVPMRTNTPTLDSSAASTFNLDTYIAGYAGTAIQAYSSNTDARTALIGLTIGTALSAGQSARMWGNTASAYIGFNAEL